MSRKIILLFFVAGSLVTGAQTKTANAQDSKMNAFVSNLMGKMTPDEKIGQLNLLTPGGKNQKGPGRGPVWHYGS
jgi:beta-glucosidase